MKLRFRGNSLRLRVNQREAKQLAGGAALEERIHFPGNANMSYILQPVAQPNPEATFEDGVIKVSAPKDQLERWAITDSIGLYFELPANGSALKIAIEKDMECIDGPEEDRDPEAYSRDGVKRC